MAKQALPLLTGGLNQVTRADLIDDSELTQSENYNIKGDGRLIKRKKPSHVDYDYGDSASLNEFQQEIGAYAWRIESWNPNFLIDMGLHPTASGMLSGVPMMVVVNTDVDINGTERMRIDLWYRYYIVNDDESLSYEWTNEVKWDSGGVGSTIYDLLLEEGIFYNLELSDPRMDVAEDKIVIVDGTNQVHYITVDSDGVAQVGTLGFDAPKNKLRFLNRFMDTTDDDEYGTIYDNAFTDNSDDQFNAPGFLQATYTVLDKYGNESNPAPYSDTLHIDYFDLEANEFTDNMWLDGVGVTDLSIPITSEETGEELEEFKIYFRWIRYSESNIGELKFQWTQTEKIIAKIATGETGNTYTIQMPPSVEQVSYENDPSPRAHQIATLNGISMIGDITQKPTFPWNFQYQHYIDIKNTTGKHYVDAVVRIRLTQGPRYSTNTNPVPYTNEIDKLDLFDYFLYRNDLTDPDNTTITFQARRDTSQYIRFFDTDQTTPLQAIVKNPMWAESTEHDHNFDVYLKIPLLPAMNTHRIYLCWTPVGAENPDNPNPQAPISTFKGVEYPYNTYPLGFENVIDNSIAVDYWDHSGIYYGGIFSTINFNDGSELVDYSGAFNILNFKHQRIFQSKGVLNEDTLVASPGDAQWTSNTAAGIMTNKSNKAKGGEFTSEDGELLLGLEPEQKVRIPAMFQSGHDSDVLFNRSIGYGGYKTLQETTSSTLNYGDLGGIPLFDKKFTIMFNMTWLDNTGTGDPTNYRSTIIVLNGEDSGQTQTPNRLTVDILHPSHDDNPLDEDIMKITFADVSPSVHELSITNRGLFEFPSDDMETGEPNAEWIQKESERPISFYDSKSKFMGFSFNNWRSDSNEIEFTIWIYDQDINGFNYIECVLPDPSSPFSNGFAEFNLCGNTEHNANVPTGHQRKDVIVQQIIFEKDRYYNGTKADDVNAMWHRLSGMPGYQDPIGYYYKGTIDGQTPYETAEHNVGIVFSKTRKVFKNRQRSLLKWSSINNFAFPTLNVARLKEPIVAIIPAPSFLSFKYANTFLVFTRNRIERVQVYPDVGTITEEQAGEFAFQNVISEKKNYGLLARDSLTLAGQSLYWLSEVGLIEWNSEGMKILSKNKIEPNLVPEAYGFVNPIDNQYIVGIPTDYLVDTWTPVPAGDFYLPYGPGGGSACARCCLPGYLGHTGNRMQSYGRELCKEMHGEYLDRLCHSNNPPWWQDPSEWEQVPCCSYHTNQVDGFDVLDWCNAIDFPEHNEDNPGGVPDPEGPHGASPCPEDPSRPCIYPEYSGPDSDQGMMSTECGEVCAMSDGWPFSRYSDYGAGQWGADAHNGYVFMNFAEFDDLYPTGLGTVRMYTNDSSDVGDAIGCGVLMNVYYPSPPGIDENSGCRRIILNGTVFENMFGGTHKYYPEGWWENNSPEKCFMPDGYPTYGAENWRWRLNHMGGGMAARVRDCPIFEQNEFRRWDGPKRYYSSAEVYISEYGTVESGYTDVGGFWWINNYLSTASSLIGFPLLDSPYWGPNNRGFKRRKNPFQRIVGQTQDIRDGSGIWHTYYLDNKKFGQYSNFNVIWSSLGKKLSGEIVNWIIDSDGFIKEWPGTDYVDSAIVKTKKFFIESGTIKKVKIDYNGESPVNVTVGTSRYKNLNFSVEENSGHSGVDITPNHYNPIDKFKFSKSFEIRGIQSNQWRGLAINKCMDFDLIISGADTINSVYYDITLDSQVKAPTQPTVTYEKKGYLDPVGTSTDKE